MTDTARYGFFPIVAGDQVTVERAYTLGAMSSGDLSMTRGGASFAAAAGNLDITQGGAWGLISGGDVTMNMAGTIGAVANSISVKDGFVGVAIGGDVSLENSKVLLTGTQAAIFGAVVGLVLAVMQFLVGGSGKKG